ncbi:hypothetical protein GCM10027040_04520 [Halomonas shantousis]
MLSQFRQGHGPRLAHEYFKAEEAFEILEHFASRRLAEMHPARRDMHVAAVRQGGQQNEMLESQPTGELYRRVR